MDESLSIHSALDHPSIAAYANAAAPVWLFRADGTGIVWANAAGCKAFGAATLAALTETSSTPDDAVAREVARLAATLVPGRAARLERLRGFSPAAQPWQALLCACSLIDLGAGHFGVWVVAAAADAAPTARRAAQTVGDGERTGAIAADAPQSSDCPGATQETAARATDAAGKSAARGPLQLRFTWQMDAAGRFTVESDKFTEILGRRIAIALGRPWREINAELALDPEDRFAKAAATKDTFSHVTVSWPVDGCEARLDVELAGLPVFDRARNFLGYRGFGVCRGTDRLENLRAARRLAAPAENMASGNLPAEAATGPPVAAASSLSGETAPEGAGPLNVVRFPDVARPSAAATSRSATRTFETIDAAHGADSLINQLPAGILVYRFDELLYANRAFLALTGYPDLDALTAAGGLDALFIECGVGAIADADGSGRTLAIARQSGDCLPVEGRLFTIAWKGEPACAVVLTRIETEPRVKAAETARREAETQARELRLMLEAATDAVLVIDAVGDILSSDRGGEAIFGRRAGELLGCAFADLFMADSRQGALEALARAHAGAGYAEATLFAQAAAGCQVAVTLIIKRIAADCSRFGVAVRIVPPPKREGGRPQADRVGEPPPGLEANTSARNAVGPVPVNLNKTVTECVMRLQGEANEARVIVRMALSHGAALVTADDAAVQRMVTALLRHALSTSPPGGQIIISTAVAADAGAYLRLRHYGDRRSPGKGGGAPPPSHRPQPGAPVAEDRHLGATAAIDGEAFLQALAQANEAVLTIVNTARDGALFELSFAAR